MITYEFTAPGTTTIFKLTWTADAPAAGELTGMVKIPFRLEIPLQLCLPLNEVKDKTRAQTDIVKARITTAIEKMVEELNNPESS